MHVLKEIMSKSTLFLLRAIKIINVVNSIYMSTRYNEYITFLKRHMYLNVNLRMPLRRFFNLYTLTINILEKPSCNAKN